MIPFMNFVFFHYLKNQTTSINGEGIVQKVVFLLDLIIRNYHQ